MIIQLATGFDGAAYLIKRGMLLVDGDVFRGPAGMQECREFAAHHARVRMAMAIGLDGNKPEDLRGHYGSSLANRPLIWATEYVHGKE